MPQVICSILQLKMAVSVHSPVSINKESDFSWWIFDDFITRNLPRASFYAHLNLYRVNLFADRKSCILHLPRYYSAMNRDKCSSYIIFVLGLVTHLKKDLYK